MTRPNLRGVPGWFVRHRANIAATAQQATASLAGEIPYEGAITAELAQAVFGGAGVQHPEGGIAAVLQQATTALFGVQHPQGAMEATLQPALFAGVGAVPVDGGMAAQLQAPAAAFAGGQAFAGTFTAQLRAATAAMAGTHVTPVAFNAVGGGGTASATFGAIATASWSHTASGSNRAVVLAAAIEVETAFTSVSATYGGNAMTLLVEEGMNNSDTDTKVVLFGLLNPPTGAQTVNCSADPTSIGGVSVAASSTSYNNVGSFGATDAEFGSGTSRSQTVASAANEMVVQAFGQRHPTAMTSYNQTQRDAEYINDAENAGLLLGDAVGTGSNISYTASGPSATWAGVSVRLVPV